MAKHKSVDVWQQIEREYRTTDDSIYEIADRHDISRAAIQKRAKAEKWQRPVAPRNQRQLDRQPPPPAPVAHEKPLDPGSIADNGRGLVFRMLDELDVTTSRRGELEDMIEAATADDQDDSRRVAMERAISLPARAATLQKLALSLKGFNEAAAPQGKKAQQQEQAQAVANRFGGLGPPTLKAVK